MSTVATETAYDQLIKRTKEANSLGATISLLHWDQEVMMPKKGIEFRADQISLTSRMHHELTTDDEIGDLLEACESDSEIVGETNSVSAVNVREIRHRYDRATKLTSSLVEE